MIGYWTLFKFNCRSMLETSIIVVYNSLHIAFNVKEIQANNMV